MFISRKTPIAAGLAIAFAPVVYAQSAAESNWSAGANQIRAPYAHTRPAQTGLGRGVTVAVLDSGMNVTHREFSGRIAPGARSIVTNTGIVTDRQGHGTFVASLIAANRDNIGMYGVAPLASILPVQVVTATSGSWSSVDSGLKYSIGKAQIINLSLGASGPLPSYALKAAVDTGQLIVAAAGNSGGANPEWPARYAKEAWARGQIIAVGAVDRNNRIASFSNRAGDTANWFLVAPGVDQIGASAASNTGFTQGSGTSFSAPLVSGAAAVVKGYWPQLSMQAVANVLFRTATDLGTPGVDAIFGRGLVNLERALQPIGTSAVPIRSASAAPLSAVTIAPGGAIGAGLRSAAAEGAFRGVALDEMGRQFHYDFGQGIAKPQPLNVNGIFGFSDRQLAFSERVLKDGSRLQVATDAGLGAFAQLGGLYAHETRDRASTALAGFAYTRPLGTAEVSIGTLGFAGMYFGVGGMDFGESPRPVTPALNNPYFGLVRGHTHIGFGTAFDDGTRLKYGLLTSAGSSAMLSQYGTTSAMPQSNMIVAEVSRPVGPAVLGVTAGQLREAGSYLGGSAGDAFAMTARPETNVVSMQAGLKLAPGWAIAGQYTTGITRGFANPGSLVVETATTRAHGFALALVKADAAREGDRLTLAVHQPLRATTGSMTLEMPVDVDAQGNILYGRNSFGLKPTGRELVTELNYFRPLDRSSGLSVVLINRHSPNHDAAAPSERIAAVRLQKSF